MFMLLMLFADGAVMFMLLMLFADGAVMFMLLMLFADGAVILVILSIVVVTFPCADAVITTDPKIDVAVNADTIPIIKNRFNLFMHEKYDSSYI
jgi:hypothetical protein